MTTVEIKKQIVKDINKIDNPRILEEINFLIHEQEPLDISPELELILDKSLQEIESGSYMDHKEAMQMLKNKHGF